MSPADQAEQPLTMSLNGVTVTYVAKSDQGPKPVEIAALQEIDLEVFRGDAVGVIGPNGAGKSTLLRVMAGLMAPSSGAVRVAARPHLLGVSAALNPKLSGQQNVQICCLALGLDQSDIASVAPEIHDFTELGDFMRLPVSTYSSGMRQRLAFAISVTVEPEILILDEALAVGDKDFRLKCLDRLRSIRARASTVILATHIMGEVTSSCNKALLLRAGQVEAFGDAESVVNTYMNTGAA